jgi:hypothetical protein
VSPTILRSGPYRFFFFAGDRNEPVHVHVAREDKTAKFWLSPVRPASTSASPRRTISASKFLSAGLDLTIPDGFAPGVDLVLSPLVIPNPEFPAHANCHNLR